MKRFPLLLSAAAAVGVIFTGITAAKATPKAMKLKQEAEKKKGEKLTTDETFKAVWRCYIPTALIGIGSIACIFGANNLNAKQITALSGAATLASQKYNEYVNKVKKVCGEEMHEQILKDLAAEEAKDIHVSAQGLCSNYNIDFEDAEEEPALFYLSCSKTYFTSTFSKVLQAEYHINRNFVLGMTPSINDIHDFFGLEHKEGGDELGWTYSDGYYWIDFNHIKTDLEDGMVCYIIDTAFAPETDYDDQ